MLVSTAFVLSAEFLIVVRVRYNLNLQILIFAVLNALKRFFGIRISVIIPWLAVSKTF
jgi:hypothetical protein